MLGDLATVQDHKRQLAGLRIAVTTAGGPVAASWCRAARVLHFTLLLVCPPGCEPELTTVRLLIGFRGSEDDAQLSIAEADCERPLACGPLLHGSHEAGTPRRRRDVDSVPQNRRDCGKVL